jgi:hypothetical protein
MAIDFVEPSWSTHHAIEARDVMKHRALIDACGEHDSGSLPKASLQGLSPEDSRGQRLLLLTLREGKASKR